MAVREIIKMGHPTLRRKAQMLAPESIQSEEIKTLIKDMYETMKVTNGVGLAAPQVNVPIQLAIIEVDVDNERYPEQESTPFSVFINPKIKILDKKKLGMWEGCLSVPGLRGYVERPKKIKVDYLDENGVEKSLVADGFQAVVLQHELDHLQGILYIDKIKDSKHIMYEDMYDEFVLSDEEEE